MEGTKGDKKRSRAGLSTSKRHRKEMMGPWSYALFAVLLASLALFVLLVAGLIPVWVAASSLPAMLVTYVVWDKKTDPVNDTWGEGARGEKKVGAELERLHEQGFHIFHDWDSGRGNVDHFVVGPQGVFAVETKAWNGKIAAEGDKLLKDGRPVRDNAPSSRRSGTP